jgi:hypothetical protein
MVPVRARLVIARSGSVENGPNTMAYNTFGLIPAVSTNPIASSFRRLLTQCFAGTRMRLNATSIYWTFRQRSEKKAISSMSIHGNRLFKQVDGLHAVGPFKNSLLQA